MEEEKVVKVLSISELVRRSRPLTGASSLTPSSSFSSSSKPNEILQPSGELPKLASTIRPALHYQNPNPGILNSLNRPTILIGTVNLPNSDNPSTSNPIFRCSRTHCFSFSDGSSAVCCDILDLDLRIIGKKIHVLAWNFIPSKCGGGFLEIIDWILPDSSCGLSPCSSNSDVFPLVLGSSFDSKDISRAQYRIYGPIESVSPVSVVPCTMGFGSSWRNSRPNSSSPRNLSGFFATIMVCECKLCSSKDFREVLDGTTQGQSHSFRQPILVYFSGVASSWHPVISKMIGNVISLSGLKKKLVFIGKEDCRLMHVTTEKALLHLPKLQNRLLPTSETLIKGKGECGVYTGIVTGIYMQGMAVELDHDVWLLLTDHLLAHPHSLRVGAIVSLKNVHFVNPKFYWTKILILGACCKTSIIVKSFSPMETGCHIYSQSHSLLGKFIDSLAFSARLWLLLMVSSFKKKFSGVLSEKEILGSKHMEGLVQTYASSCLPSSVYRSRHGVFTEYCKHESCGCGNEPNYGHLKLVIPISSFVGHCDATWIKMLSEWENDCDLMGNRNQFGLPSHEGRVCGQSIRRILRSEDLGVVLLGNLKISPSSGRLQLIDATGGIDVVIPDLLSTWNINDIYEVNDFTLVAEGKPEQVDCFGLLCDESFSCRSVFNCVSLARKMNLGIYIHFYLRDTKSRNHPFHPCISSNGNFEEIESGRFHLLQITHKFPLLKNLQGEKDIANKASIFAEAIFLPWDLFLGGKGGDTHSTKASADQLKESVEHYANSKCQEQGSCKKCKIDGPFGLSSAGSGSCGSLNCCCSAYRKSYLEPNCSDLSSQLEIPCLATFRSVNDHSLPSSGNLSCTKSCVKVDASVRPSGRKILLEFKYESFCKYQLLQIGGYYIIKHHEDEILCTLKDSDNIGGSKALLTSRMHFWSLSFYSDKVLQNTNPCILSFNDSFICNKEVLYEGTRQIELPFRFDGHCPEISSDISLYLCADVVSFLEMSLKVLEDSLVKPSAALEEFAHISQCSRTMITASVQYTGISESDCLLPEGNLISLHGYVVAVHNSDCSSFMTHSSLEISNDALQPNFFHGGTSSVCVHVLVDHRTVRIFGALSKHAYPVGFGPDVNATFHRILVLGGQNELLFTPASFIVINCVKVVNYHLSDECCNPSVASGLHSAAFRDTIPSGLISEIIQCLECKPMQFHCRVVAVHILVLEKRSNSPSRIHSRSPVVNIPLAGFVLDDGSSLCCCWANSERAATLLRLHEEIPHNDSYRSYCSSNKIESNMASSSAIHQVDKILKKLNRVIVKNHGSMFDSSSQDLTFSVGSDNVFSSSDEDLLKFIILNACFGTSCTVVGSLMDSDAIGQLEKCLQEVDMIMCPVQNIWAREVYYTNPLTKARNIIQELLDR